MYSKCVLSLSYGARGCLLDTDCSYTQGLICNNKGSICNCPLTSRIGACDCAKFLNNEYFWNGFMCQAASFYNESCKDNFMCQTITQGTLCNRTDKISTCQCPNLQYFDSKSGRCREQVSFNQSCFSNMTNMCRIGTVCLNGKCR